MKNIIFKIITYNYVMKNCNKTITFTKVIDYNFNKFFYINFYIENLSPLVDKIEGHGNMHHERIFSLKGA